MPLISPPMSRLMETNGILWLCALISVVSFTVWSGPLETNKSVQVREVDQMAMGVAIDGSWLYCIAGTNLYALDISEPMKPKVVGVLGGMDNRRQVVVSEGFAYVVSRETGLRIVDVRDPMDMKLCSRYDSIEFATGIDVVGKTAFLSERINGVEVVDVSDPYHPRHVCIRKTKESQSNRYCNGYLYSGEWCSGSVTIFDARDLKTFHQVGSVELGGFGDGVDVVGRYLYCSTGHDARHHRAAELKSGHVEREQDGLSDPTVNDEAFLGAGRGLDIFSLTDPAKPQRISRVNFPVFKPRDADYWTVRVSNGLAFCCDSHNGLFVVDVTDPVRPKVVDRFCVPQVGKSWPSSAISSVAIGEGCIYVTSCPGGLWAIPVRNARPQMVKKGDPPKNGSVAERYLTDESVFSVYRPTQAGQARTVCIRGDVAYVAFGDAGLHVVGLTEKGFERLGELQGGRRVTDCCFVGDRLVTAEGLDGFAVYMLDGPAEFREVSRRHIVVKDNYSSSVAFWCWPVTADKVVLTTRYGAYQVFTLDDLKTSEPLLKFWCGCPWDKYLPDGLVGGRLAILCPYAGLMWVNFEGLEPKVEERESRRSSEVGNQGNGVCVFGDKYLLTVGGRYQFVAPDGARTELRDLPRLASWGNNVTGIPRSNGRLVVLTNRSNCRYFVYDFSDSEHPKALRSFELSGNPDLAAFYGNHILIPAGHQGLLLER